MRRAILSVLVAALFVCEAGAQTIDITVIDVRQGDSILIEFPPGSTGKRKTMLIDGGLSTSATNSVMQLLSSKGITTLDFVVLTHPHFDHYAGLIPVMNNLTVREFWWTGEFRGPPRDNAVPSSWEKFEDAKAKAQEERLVTQGMKRSSQKAKIKILNAGGEYPDTDKGRDINNDSIVMMLTYKNVKVLFTGDIEGEEGRDLVDDFCNRSRDSCSNLNADIIKIPHHGSAEFSSDFVKFVDAEFVLISAGHKNKQHHHPREAAIEAYQQAGAQHISSTSAPDRNDLTVTIGPAKGRFEVNGAETGYTYWRPVGTEPCTTEVDDGFCLMFAQ